MSTIKISELTSSGAILGNVLVPIVGNIAGTLTTIKSTVDQLKTFIVASAEANILAANAATIFANTIMKSYVDLANTIQSAQLTSANIGIIGYVDNAVSTANIGIKGYVDSVASQSIYGNGNVTSYTVAMGFTNFSNVNVAAYVTTNGLTNYSNVNTKAYAESMGYQNYGNVNVAAYVTTANSAVVGYVDNAVSTANVGMNGFVNAVIDAVNVANIVVTQSIVSANLGMKGYVDNSVINSTANIAMKGYVDLGNTIQSNQISAANLGMKGYVDSVASQSIYGNSNVKSYLTGGFDGNIIPSANVTYSLGSITNQWKDLYVSGNTIYIGGSQLSVAGNGISINGSKINASKSAPANAEGQSGDTIGDVAIDEFTGNAYTPIRSYYCKQTYAGEVVYSGINGTSGGAASGVLRVDAGSRANMGNVRVGWIMYGSPITGNATITSILRGPGSPAGSTAWELTINQAVDLRTATNITVQGRPAIWLRSAVLDDWGTT